jgi:hypothetical protein
MKTCDREQVSRYESMKEMAELVEHETFCRQWSTVLSMRQTGAKGKRKQRETEIESIEWNAATKPNSRE